jgi:hypothetical protein
LASYQLRALTRILVAFALAASTAQGQITLKSPAWKDLPERDRQVLAPLASDWDHIDAARKQKWLGIARRYSSLRPDEQERIQSQMRFWSRLTPEQRNAARERYKSLKSLPPDKRSEMREKWREYQNLSPEQRRELEAKPPRQTGPGRNPVPPPPRGPVAPSGRPPAGQPAGPLAPPPAAPRPAQ